MSPEIHRHHFLKLVVWLIAIVILIAVVYFGAPFIESTLFKSAPTNQSTNQPTDMSAFFDAIGTGDYTSALREADRIKNDPNVSASDKALIALNLAVYDFNATGNKESRNAAITAVKDIITDEHVDVLVRVQAINYLATSYNNSGRDPDIIKEIFKNPPFSNYLVQNDPDLSIRKLYEWSYSLKPTAIAAINISSWYTEQGIGSPPDHTPHALPENIKAAQEYLNKADELSAEEAAGVKDYTNSSAYISYRFLRTLIISRLALQVGEPYRNLAEPQSSMWLSTYREFLKFAYDSKNPAAKNSEVMGRYFFATYLRIGNFPGFSQKQYYLLSKEMSNLTVTSSFVQFLVNAHKDPSGDTWKTVVGGYKSNPSFETAVNKVITTWSK